MELENLKYALQLCQYNISVSHADIMWFDFVRNRTFHIIEKILKKKNRKTLQRLFILCVCVQIKRVN